MIGIEIANASLIHMEHDMNLKFIVLAASLGISLAGAQAAVIVDQDASTNTAYMAHFSQTNLAQSFQQNAGNIAGAGIFLQSGVGSSDNVTISLFDKLPNNGGTLLASGTALGTQGNWIDVFWGPVAIAADTTYFLVFTSGTNTLGIAGDVTNTYKRGQTYANTGFGPFPSYDYTFRTYADDAFGGTVSEPGALALFGLGLMGVTFARRRQA